MPKLTISRQEWFQAASDGNIQQLEKWKKTGALETRYDPVRVHSASTSGRPKIFDVFDDENNSALHKAIQFGQIEYAQKLMQIANFPDRGNKKGETFVHLSLVLKEKGTVLLKQLHDKGYSIDTPDKIGCTPLHWAISHNNLENFAYLLDQGVRLDQPNDIGDPPLQRVVIHSNVKMAQLLLEKGADPNQVCEKQSKNTAFHTAVIIMNLIDWQNDQSNGMKILRLLLKHGADENKTLIEKDGSLLKPEDLLPATFLPAKMILKKLYTERDFNLLSQETPVINKQKSGMRL